MMTTVPALRAPIGAARCFVIATLFASFAAQGARHRAYPLTGPVPGSHLSST